jgi:hypothetical protein
MGQRGQFTVFSRIKNPNGTKKLSKQVDSCTFLAGNLDYFMKIKPQKSSVPF